MNGFAINPAQPVKKSTPPRRMNALGFVAALFCVGLFLQAAVVVHARPQDLVTGAAGIADIVSRSMPPDLSALPDALWPALETIDMGLFGTAVALVFALPIALFAARNTTPAKPLYYAARGLIALARVVPDLVWALIFVAAVGLGPFPGALAIVIHSLGMMGRLFAETIEDIDMGPVDALSMTGASRLAVFTHGVIPTVIPSLLGITLYRLDENIRSSLILGFVGAGGIGFQLLTAMNLFQYRTVSMLLVLTFAIVVGAERISAALRQRIA
ncbi:phosphonate ABC transporter, permease protein PhnE [Acidisoma sp. 7E03]